MVVLDGVGILLLCGGCRQVEDVNVVARRAVGRTRRPISAMVIW